MKAVITGASSGIGAAFARALAARGHDLLLTGRRINALETEAQKIRERCSVRVDIWPVELAERAEVQAFAQYLQSQPVDTLINNAGYGIQCRFDGLAYEKWETMMQVHALAPMQLCRSVIPQMKDRRCGRIINVSSMAAFFPMPGNAVYSSSKGFLNQFSEGLSMELSPFDIQVQALCPGFTRSDFHQRMAQTHRPFTMQRFMRWQSAEHVVTASLRSLERGSLYCIPGFSNWMLITMGRLVPRSWWRRLAPLYAEEMLKDSP